MRVIVCGGRYFADNESVWRELDALHQSTGHLLVMQGGATGADALARQWCAERFVTFRNYPADWNQYRRAAGPIRNQRMLDDGQPTLVLAFPGGNGTADMVKRAKAAGVPVKEVSP